YPTLLLALGLTTLPLSLVHSVPVAIVLAFVAGPAWAPVLSCQYILVGKTAPRGTVTEAFTWSQAGFAGGLAGGSAVGGVLVGGAGVSAATVVGSLVFVLAATLPRVNPQVVDGGRAA